MKRSTLLASIALIVAIVSAGGCETLPMSQTLNPDGSTTIHAELPNSPDLDRIGAPQATLDIDIPAPAPPPAGAGLDDILVWMGFLLAGNAFKTLPYKKMIKGSLDF